MLKEYLCRFFSSAAIATWVQAIGVLLSIWLTYFLATRNERKQLHAKNEQRTSEARSLGLSLMPALTSWGTRLDNGIRDENWSSTFFLRAVYGGRASVEAEFGIPPEIQAVAEKLHLLEETGDHLRRAMMIFYSLLDRVDDANRAATGSSGDVAADQAFIARYIADAEELAETVSQVIGRITRDQYLPSP